VSVCELQRINFYFLCAALCARVSEHVVYFGLQILVITRGIKNYLCLLVLMKVLKYLDFLHYLKHINYLQFQVS
jgi:hypothetical protein